MIFTKKKILKLVLVTLFLLILTLDKSFSKPERDISGESDSPTQAQSENVQVKEVSVSKVVKVIDGDTIVLANGDRVRYIGVDAPEMSHGGECFSAESKTKNTELVLDKEVNLERDISDKDKYGRLLRYVRIGEIFVNEKLVEEGFANASTYPPDVKYQTLFSEKEREARENGRGLWEICR